MKFIDEVEITVVSGKGGNGCVGFRREKYVPNGGPDGGDGGRGGDIIFKSNNNLSTLADVRHVSTYKAENGKNGSGSNKKGKNGKSVIIHVPCGTIIKDGKNNKILSDLNKNNQEFLAAKGGRGGRGNTRFKQASVQSPDFAEQGGEAQVRELKLELKLLADVGIVGLPNSGKSTLLSRISSAKPKVAAYPFTTLVPNLGIVEYDKYKTFVVADVPGLIEGAHAGKGLGIKFLKHVERTDILVVTISAESEDFDKVFQMIYNELESFNKSLTEKPMIFAISKVDILSDEQMKLLPSTIRGKEVVTISSITGFGLDRLINRIISFL
ncbi:MAG: GTPase ObgE [bacterium]